MNLFHEVADDFLELYYDDVEKEDFVDDFTDMCVPHDVKAF